MQNRRTLHEPFFPTPSAPPPSSSSSSSSSNSNSPPFPKYPFSSNPQQPFFPNYPSPPPPSTSNVPTFPANLSSLIYPQNGNYTTASHHKHSSTGKLLPSILISLILLSLLSLTAAFLFHRRRRRHHHHLTPKKPTPPPPPPPPPVHPSAVPPTSDFLYLGTLVNSQNHHHHRTHSQTLSRSQSYASNETNAAVPAGGSPELRPLPPLAKSVRTNYANATDSDEEFYSPKGSDNPIGTRSSSRREFQFPAGDEKTGSDFSSTPSYPDSNSDNGSESPNGFGSKHPRSASPPTAPPPPPPPPPPMRPHTPSPPKRKLPSPSPISSPARNSRSSARSPSPARFQATPPPPPPPPPPVGYWESQVRKPPVVVKPRSVNFNVNRIVETGSGAEVAESWESVVEMSEETMPRPRPKLKPLHWDKVRASSDRVTVWDQLKTSSFQVNEEMIETLFGTANAAPKEVSKSHQVLPSPKKQEVDRVLDPKKSQNIAILLRALNVTKEEVCEALLEGNTDSLGTDLLETLLKMAPSKEEEIKLKEYKDDSPFKLGPAEKFLKALLDIPFAFKRVDAMLYIANFDSEVSYLKNSFETLEAACEELRNSRLFLKLLEAVLKTGNRMNVGTNRGDAHAFKLDTLLKLVDVKGTDGKITLLHFVVQEIIRTEGSRQLTPRTQANTLKDDLHCKRLGLQVVSGLGGELANVKKAASMDSEVLSSYVSKLAGGIGKISEVLRLNESLSMRNTISIQFQERMDGFLKKAEDGIIKVQAQESVALSLVKEITEYFHGNSAKEEAHPFRIFMVVRDFLSILDQVCKEVGRINEKSIASSARQFPVPVNPTLPPLFPKIQALRPESSDDENSSSSS